MQNFRKPEWLFVVNSLPIAVLFILAISQFNLIKTLLDERSIYLWKVFGLLLGALGLSNFAYALYLSLKKQLVSVAYGFLALLVYIAFLYGYFYCLESLLPFSIPEWIMSRYVVLYVGTFLMPTLAYALITLILYFTPEGKDNKAGPNFLVAIGIPAGGYLFSQIIFPLWQPIQKEYFVHVILILIISATLAFLFFLLRGVFILAARKIGFWQKYQLFWKIPIALILPLLGLLTNSGYIFHQLGIDVAGVFGNFDGAWFYILAVINAILICLPNIDNKMYRLFLFVGRSITFAYTLYFFLVFLPFLPFSVLAIIAVGVGFLMLAPALLFVVHTNELSKDIGYLKNYFSKGFIIGLSLLGFLFIPLCITATYLKDRQVLNSVLSYVYTPDYAKQYHIDKKSLAGTLSVIEQQKEQRFDSIFGNQTPYLSSYFNSLVLGNLSLPAEKIDYIKQIFFGTPAPEPQSAALPDNNLQISHIHTRSNYDAAQKAWKSWIDLEITNHSNNSLSEYTTTFRLPEGCWISDYYLYVGDKKEQGLLAEKKTAMWVFSNIRSTRRDPGILHYLTGNKVAFKVFPFSANEVRKTGIEFLHKDPISITIDGHSVQLGNDIGSANENIETDNMLYVSAKQKQLLKSVRRKPYFHFLVDASKDKDSLSDNFIKRIELVANSHKTLLEGAKISFVNTYMRSVPMDKTWKQHYKTQAFDGGFYLDMAIKMALINAYKSNTYPVIVVVSDSIENAVLGKDFADFKFLFPESNLFYQLDNYGGLHAHSLSNNAAQALADTTTYTFDQTVLEYKLSDSSSVYLPNDDEASIFLKKAIFELNTAEIKERTWQSAMTLQGSWQTQILHPEISDKEWLNLVKYSFASKIMTPLTAYLVVENEAQKAALEKKQKQVLAGNKSLEAGEDVQRMSEPNIWVSLMIIVLVLWYAQKRKYLRE